MSKSLFDEDGKYTHDAFLLETMVEGAIKKAFTRFIVMGYSPREISHIIQLVVNDSELESILLKEKK